METTTPKQYDAKPDIDHVHQILLKVSPRRNNPVSPKFIQHNQPAEFTEVYKMH